MEEERVDVGVDSKSKTVEVSGVFAVVNVNQMFLWKGTWVL